MKSYSLTALCLCTIIGAGFATGRELVTYFVNYGIYGFVGIALSSLLFGISIYLIINSPYTSIKELTENKLPRQIAFVADKIVFLFLIVIYSAMLAAGGEVLGQMFNLDKNICSALSGVVCLVIISCGTEVLTELSKILIIPMAIIILAIGHYTTGVDITSPPENIFTLKTVTSPIIYLSYNMITAIALIVTLPKAENPRNVALQTGVGIFILALVLSLPLYTHYGVVANEALPLMAILIEGSKLRFFYIMLLLFAILTTAVSNGYSAVLFLPKGIPTIIRCVVLTIVAYLLSLIGFSSIVDKVYFIFGIAGMMLLYCLINIKNKKS